MHSSYHTAKSADNKPVLGAVLIVHSAGWTAWDTTLEQSYTAVECFHSS